jgi:hypothetical protein
MGCAKDQQLGRVRIDLRRKGQQRKSWMQSFRKRQKQRRQKHGRRRKRAMVKNRLIGGEESVQSGILMLSMLSRSGLVMG